MYLRIVSGSYLRIPDAWVAQNIETFQVRVTQVNWLDRMFLPHHKSWQAGALYTCKRLGVAEDQ